MKHKYIDFTICLIIIIFLFEIFSHTKIVIDSIYNASYLWFKNIVPTLLPFYIISDLLINYGLIDLLSDTFGKVLNKLFKIKKEANFVFIMSIFSGFPSNSKFIKQLLDNKTINTQEATKLLSFTHFSNPLFIVGTIGVLFLNNKNIGIIILLVHFLTNIIIGLIFRNYYISNNSSTIKKSSEKLPFVKCLSNSITSTINTLLLIYGIITIFYTITSLINININLNTNLKIIITGFLEMTQGLKYLSSSNLNIIYKATLSTLFISFGGLSVHMQVVSILSSYRVKYLPYLLSRLIHAFISSIIIYFILLWLY